MPLTAADALAHIERQLAIDPGNARWLIQRGQCLLALGRLADAHQAAAAAQGRAAKDPVLLDAIGTLYRHANDQQRALAAYSQAVEIAPDNAHFLFNRATVRRFLGLLLEAEADYDRVIALNPADFEAYRNRSELRTQSAGSNHVAELERVVAHSHADWQGQVQLRYALAKEYEDLGEYGKSFQHLQEGARVRRQHLRYDVRSDLATVDWIIEAFPAAAYTEAAHASDAAAAAAVTGTAAPKAAAAGGAAGGAAPSDAPIFIVGLPRSGSTLVDRILGSHSRIQCAGELKHFALAIVDAVRLQSDGTALSRRELVARSATLDFVALGRDYLDRARGVVGAGTRFTDKMPLNYLYCGLIARALPRARIVHVSREPMAACYAIYKTLFADGYPFSYDLAELAQYYAGYRRLMAHWSAMLPQTIHHLSYEELVADQPGQTRRLLQFCGLEWQDACAQFHLNPAPTTTASAAQVRRPLYDTSLQQWRHYQQQLAALASELRAAGIRFEP